MLASPAAMPAINGIDRRKPKFAPEAADMVVAPPGVMDETSAKMNNGRTASSDMRFSGGYGGILASAGYTIRETHVDYVQH
jgi:hypothetical protein